MEVVAAAAGPVMAFHSRMKATGLLLRDASCSSQYPIKILYVCSAYKALPSYRNKVVPLVFKSIFCL